METNTIRKKIEKLPIKDVSCGIRSGITYRRAIKEAINLIPRDHVTISEKLFKSWTLFAKGLGVEEAIELIEKTDCVLVPKKDLLTDEEISNLSRCYLANGSPTKEKETDKIFKKLKALSVKDNRFVTKKDLIGNNIVVKKK